MLTWASYQNMSYHSNYMHIHQMNVLTVEDRFCSAGIVRPLSSAKLNTTIFARSEQRVFNRYLDNWLTSLESVDERLNKSRLIIVQNYPPWKWAKAFSKSLEVFHKPWTFSWRLPCFFLCLLTDASWPSSARAAFAASRNLDWSTLYQRYNHVSYHPSLSKQTSKLHHYSTVNVPL